MALIMLLTGNEVNSTESPAQNSTTAICAANCEPGGGTASPGAVIGAAVGSVILAVLAVQAGYVCWAKRRIKDGQLDVRLPPPSGRVLSMEETRQSEVYVEIDDDDLIYDDDVPSPSAPSLDDDFRCGSARPSAAMRGRNFGVGPQILATHAPPPPSNNVGSRPNEWSHRKNAEPRPTPPSSNSMRPPLFARQDITKRDHREISPSPPPPYRPTPLPFGSDAKLTPKFSGRGRGKPTFTPLPGDADFPKSRPPAVLPKPKLASDDRKCNEFASIEDNQAKSQGHEYEKLNRELFSSK